MDPFFRSSGPAPTGAPPSGPRRPSRSRLLLRIQGAAAAPPEQPTARRSTVHRDVGWCWTGVSGWGRKRLRGVLCEALGKGDLGRLRGEYKLSWNILVVLFPGAWVIAFSLYLQT